MLTVASASTASGKPDKLVEVFVLTGQSNAVRIPADQLESNLEAILGADSPNHVTTVFKQAYSGTSIEVDWKPDGTAGNDGDGTTYRHFQTKFDAFLANLEIANPGAQIRISGLFWNQGERDARLGYGDIYEDNLNLMIADFRATMDTPQLPVFVSRIKGINAYVDNAEVRAAQQAVGETDPFVVTMDVDDVEPFDGLHWGAAGFAELARIYADVYGQIMDPASLECGKNLVTVAECVRLQTAEVACVSQDGRLTVVVGTSYDGGDLLAGVAFGDAEQTTATVNATTDAEFIYSMAPDGPFGYSIYGSSFEVDRGQLDIDCNTYLKGDANCDGEVTSADVDTVLGLLVEAETPGANCDEEFNRLYNCDLDTDDACRLADARNIATCLLLDGAPLSCDQ